jgi:hypothetical protein
MRLSFFALSVCALPGDEVISPGLAAVGFEEAVGIAADGFSEGDGFAADVAGVC